MKKIDPLYLPVDLCGPLES